MWKVKRLQQHRLKIGFIPDQFKVISCFKERLSKKANSTQDDIGTLQPNASFGDYAGGRAFGEKEGHSLKSICFDVKTQVITVFLVTRVAFLEQQDRHARAESPVNLRQRKYP